MCFYVFQVRVSCIPKLKQFSSNFDAVNLFLLISSLYISDKKNKNFLK